MSDLYIFLERIFLSADDNRPRALWRLISQTTGYLTLTTILSLPLAAAAVFVGQNFLTLSPGNLFIGKLIETVSLLGTIYLARRWLDRRSIKSLGFAAGQAWKDLGAGIGMAFLMIGAIFWGSQLAGWLEVEAWAWEVEPAGDVLLLLVIMGINFILVGFGEELWLRGYILQNLEDGMNTPAAVVLSSAIFGILHIGNPNATLISTLGIVLAGLLFAFAYLRTRQLWLPIGIHFGWNFFENTVFGFPVSGLDTQGLIRHIDTGPELITGGAFGPEAGLVLLPALALGFTLIYFWTRAKKIHVS